MNTNSLGNRLGNYLAESLSLSGFAFVSGRILFELNPHVWASPNNVGSDLTAATSLLEQFFDEANARRFLIKFRDTPEETIKLIARSSDNLARRVQWITGRQVASVEEVACLFDAAPAPAATAEGQRRGDPGTIRVSAAASCSSAPESRATRSSTDRGMDLARARCTSRRRCRAEEHVQVRAASLASGTSWTSRASTSASSSPRARPTSLASCGSRSWCGSGSR